MRSNAVDPGHLNLGSTGTGSKTSQGRRDFEFLQLNMHHSKGGSFNLRRSLDRGQIDVALFQEPQAYKSLIRGFNSKQGSIATVLFNSYSNRDIVAEMIKYTRDTKERNLIC
jgi:hypothetical protein